MRPVLYLLFSTGLLAQIPKPIHVNVLNFSSYILGVEEASPLPQSEAMALVKPILESRGFNLVDEATAKANPNLLVLEIGASDLRSVQGNKGFFIHLQLAESGAMYKGMMDAKAVKTHLTHVFQSKAPIHDRMIEDLKKVTNQVLDHHDGPQSTSQSPGPDPSIAIPKPAPPSTSEETVFLMDFAQVKVQRQPSVPLYPHFARSQRAQGKVNVVVTMDPTGKPSEAYVNQDPWELQGVAAFYALQWSFAPANFNGQSQWARFDLIMPFRLTYF